MKGGWGLPVPAFTADYMMRTPAQQRAARGKQEATDEEKRGISVSFKRVGDGCVWTWLMMRRASSTGVVIALENHP